MRAVFKDNSFDEQFKKDGFLVVDMLNAAEADNLYNQSLGFKNALKDNFYTTIGDPDMGNRLLGNHIIRAAITPKINNLLVDFDILYSTFIAKKRGIRAKIGIHADWQFVEEPHFISINTWVALKDTNRWNGGLWVVKGSHSNIRQLRGPNYEFDTTVLNNIKNKPELIKLKAGQAILYDSRLLHASGYNILSPLRVAASALLIPCEALPVYVYFKPGKADKPFYMQNVDRNFYLEKCNFQKENNVWRFSNPDAI